jgi:hypothetical protein
MKAYFQILGKSTLSFAAFFWQLFFGLLPFTLIASVMGYTGQKVAQLNGEYFQGIYGAIIPIVTHFFIAIVGGMILWTVLYIGRKLLEFFF